ncbi:hypothetical protein ACQCU1_03230 [Sutcliffiella horikoshii]|uniref:hypothetical protein n=1 Tax=Sutcliffiella horikoshii TaxID=79883 RepID=UPI003CF8D9DB
MSVTVNKTLLFTVHHIDNSSSTTNKVSVVTSDIEKYTNKLFFQTLAATNKRYYTFERETTEIAQIVHNLVENCDIENFSSLFEAKADLIAEKLLNTQQTYIQRYPGINPPKKGSLVVIYLKSEDKIEILISKIDEKLFMSLEDYLYKAGLPDENATQKSCGISFKLLDNSYQLQEIVVTDSKPKISTFWSQEFLSLRELKTNEKNTVNAFNFVDSVLSKNLQKQSRKDYNELRNNLVGYFQTNSSFNFEEMVEYVIGDYSSENTSIDISSIKRKVENLPNEKDFDTSFQIVKSEIKARFKRSYKISEKIELRTSDYIENLGNIIVAKENELGEKVLEIKNIDEKIFETFKAKED